MAIYVAQYDWIWKLTQVQWRTLCAAGARGEGYDLEPYRRLKSKPNFIHRSRGERSFWTSRSDVTLVQPLDWTPEDFADHLEGLMALDR